MNTIYLRTNLKPSRDGRQDRRIFNDRRVSSGRRSMVRFDKTGGDRRSGYARRSSDEGFREQFWEN